MHSPRLNLPPVIVAVVCVSLSGLSSLVANPGKAVVTGKFLGDGKDAKIQHLVVENREPFSDKAAIQLVFTEKDPSKSKKPGWDAGFKKLGSALVLSVFQDGGVFGCEVAHSAHEKSPFSSVGKIQIKDFKATETHVSGQVTTGGELEFFGQKWEVDLTFSAPLPKGAFAEAKKEAPPAEKEDAPEVAEAKGPKPSASELPLPAGAAEVEYKAVVEQLACRVDSPVSVVAADYAAKLKQQGWKEMPGSLVSKTNAILKRAKDGADLTIMIQPAGKGCTVKVFGKGLDWSKAPAAAPAKPAAPVDFDAIEDEANRLINDALKQIPKRP